MEGEGREDDALSKPFCIVLTLESKLILYISKNKSKLTKMGKKLNLKLNVNRINQPNCILNKKHNHTEGKKKKVFD